MSDVLAELARVSDAYQRPTLNLLHKQHAGVIITLFRTCFGRELTPVATDRLHALVSAHLAELAHAGIDVPQGTGRDLCRGWMREQFLRRVPTDDGSGEVYELTAAAVDALGVVTSLTRERQMFGEHRINTILNTVRQFNADVNPDRQARVEILTSEIDAREKERARLLAGGELAPVTEDTLLEGFVNLMGLLEGLPGDFQRVREAFGAMRRDIIAAFRSDSPEIGSVLTGYLRGTEDLMAATPEGRAFSGAISLLTDETMLADLRRNLDDLLSHPNATDILDAADRANLRSTLAVVTQGVTDVLGERNRLTGTLRQRIVTHDAAADKALDATLRDLEYELGRWLAHAGPRAGVDVEVLPARLTVSHLRGKLYDPRSETPPPPLATPDDADGTGVSMEQLRAQGGPSLSQYRSLLAEAFSAAEPPASVGALFNRLRPDLRRPVEVFGVVHLAAGVGALTDAEVTEPYVAVRADGSTRTFHLPRMTLTGAQARRLLHDQADRGPATAPDPAHPQERAR